MLISLLRTHLSPYHRPIALAAVFQLIATMASLCPPGLNAQTIDQGVVLGDAGSIRAVLKDSHERQWFDAASADLMDASVFVGV